MTDLIGESVLTPLLQQRVSQMDNGDLPGLIAQCCYLVGDTLYRCLCPCSGNTYHTGVVQVRAGSGCDCNGGFARLEGSHHTVGRHGGHRCIGCCPLHLLRGRSRQHLGLQLILLADMHHIAVAVDP